MASLLVDVSVVFEEGAFWTHLRDLILEVGVAPENLGEDELMDLAAEAAVRSARVEVG